MNKPFKIVVQHTDFMIISKSSGVSFHGEHGEVGLFAHLRHELGDTPLFPVHRLDKVTSGLLIIARSKKSAQIFSQMFRDRSVEKYYLAISDRKPSKKQGLVCGDMETSRRGAWKLSPTKLSPAITQFFSHSLGSGKRLYLIKPHTGKTHQIRVAMKSIGAPVLGDPIYYKASLSAYDRTYLHAFSIRFIWAGEWVQINDVPTTGELFGDETFKEVLESCYTMPWSLAWPTVKKTKLSTDDDL
nr:TIGR01621 family pseudouridine synthase [Desulfobulbaceae bacterium]